MSLPPGFSVQCVLQVPGFRKQLGKMRKNREWAVSIYSVWTTWQDDDRAKGFSGKSENTVRKGGKNMNLWFYYVDGKKYGPIDDTQLRNMVGRGIIVPQTPVETDKGIRGQAGQVPGLFTAASPAFQGSNYETAPRMEISQNQSRTLVCILIGLVVFLCLVILGSLFVFLGRSTGEGRNAATPPVPATDESKTLTVKGVKYVFRWCPAGTFMMGSPEDELKRGEVETQHQVTLSRGFWMLESEVTQEMWESVMGTTIQEQTNKNEDYKDLSGVGPKYPMYNVNCEESEEFCRKLSSLSGQSVRLPSEAEWEYACRAGTSSPYSFGGVLNGDKANCHGNYPYGTTIKGKYLEQTSEVKSYSPNAWGLYDMHGNVMEWCNDWYGDYPSGSVTDPTGPEGGSRRVLRGGCWDSGAKHCRSASRYGGDPGLRSGLLGFRLALVPSK